MKRAVRISGTLSLQAEHQLHRGPRRKLRRYLGIADNLKENSHDVAKSTEADTSLLYIERESEIRYPEPTGYQWNLTIRKIMDELGGPPYLRSVAALPGTTSWGEQVNYSREPGRTLRRLHYEAFRR